MVGGIDSFTNWFRGYQDQYVIIGGTACDMLIGSRGGDFRATKDIDMVLIVEAMTPEFGRRFWEYVKEAGYEHINKSTDTPQYYRFSKPKNKAYPFMIELFSRKLESILLDENADITPIPVDDEISSLSAILLDDDYYSFMCSGTKVIDEIPILDIEHLIPFKAKAWLDLLERSAKGEHVDSRNIKKHKNDIFRLYAYISKSSRMDLPASIRNDMAEFFDLIEKEDVELKQFGITREDKDDIIAALKKIYSMD